MAILETTDLKYTYPDGTLAIEGISISIEKGKKIAFVGPNGSGKSTLFLLLNGTLEPQEGKIIFHGKPLLYDTPSLREIRKSIGIVFQNSDDQIFAPTVYQDVAFGPTNLEMTEEEVVAKVNETLEYVGLLELKDKPPHHLSGGQKKRVAVAGVVVMEPEIIILDEPLANLDPVGADEILDLLNELNQFEKTIVISTHDVDFAYSWADYIYLLVNRKIIGSGTPEEVFCDPDMLKDAGLKIPMILEIYYEIQKRNMASVNRVPKTVPEIVDTLKPPSLIWVNVPEGVKEGDRLDFGLYTEEIGKQCSEEVMDARVLHIHENGQAIVAVKRKTAGIGKVIVYDTDSYKLREIKELLASGDFDVMGAMGKRTKLILESDHLKLDFTVGVIDKSILMALCGKNVLIFTGGGMVDHAVRRISDYCKKSGVRINVGVFNRETGEAQD